MTRWKAAIPAMGIVLGTLIGCAIHGITESDWSDGDCGCTEVGAMPAVGDAAKCPSINNLSNTTVFAETGGWCSSTRHGSHRERC